MNPFYKQAIAFLILCNVFLIQGQTSTPTYNKVDSKGNKDGVWKGIYEESKRPRYEGTFNHGKETGVFKFFDDTKAGTVIATREFVAKDNSAYTIFYDQNKNKVSEGKVINKVFEGQWKYYHQASTVIMATEFYKNGKLQGLRSVYFPSGKIAEEINYKDNLKEGSYKKYSEKGIVLEESQFKNDQYNGPSIFRDVDGTIVSKGQFVNGKKEGVWQFFEKGKLVKTQNMSFPEINTKIKR